MWKSLSPKTNCNGWSTGTTMVRKWKTHSGKHHPMPENKKPNLEKHYFSVEKLKPTAPWIHEKHRSSQICSCWSTGTMAHKRKSHAKKHHPCKTLIHCRKQKPIAYLRYNLLIVMTLQNKMNDNIYYNKYTQICNVNFIENLKVANWKNAYLRYIIMVKKMVHAKLLTLSYLFEMKKFLLVTYFVGQNMDVS